MNSDADKPQVICIDDFWEQLGNARFRSISCQVELIYLSQGKINGFWPWSSLSGETLPYVPKELWPSIQQTEMIPGSDVAALCALELRETGRAVPRPAAAHSRQLFQKWSQSLPDLWCRIEIVTFSLCQLPCCVFFSFFKLWLFCFCEVTLH